MSVRDEMAWGLAKKLFPGLPWDQLYPLKQNVCLELADALMPIVERVAKEAAAIAWVGTPTDGLFPGSREWLDNIVRRVVGDE